MPFEHALEIGNAIIESIESNDLSDSTLLKLKAIFPDKMVVAALDIIDRANVIHCTTPWGHSEFQVHGSMGSYTVFLNLRNTKIPHSCTCPAFISSVLMLGNHTMCKHILATMIAHKMRLCVERPSTADDLVSIITGQFTMADRPPGGR